MQLPSDPAPRTGVHPAAALRAHLSDAGRPAGRGVTLYGADPGLAAVLAEDLRRQGHAAHLLRAAPLADGAPLALPPPGAWRGAPLVLLQDAPLATFSQVAATFVQAAQQAWEEGQPVSLVSVLAREAYSDLSLAADGLHASPESLARARGLLAAEQLVCLVEQANATGGTAGAPPRPAAQPSTRSPRGRGALAHEATGPVDADLDADQLRAVETGWGPSRILAPAGSGKTRVLTSRIRALLRRQVPASAILALAFNRRAAEEMAGRLEAHGVPVATRLDGAGVAVRTFHSLGNEVLQRELGWHYDEDADATETAIAAEAFGQHSGLEPGTYRRSEAVEFVRWHVSRAKTCLLPTEGAHLDFAGHSVPYGPLLYSFLALQRRARRHGFDDMVYLALLLLLRRAALRRQLQRHFAHVLVDEFQDLNPAQLLLADLLALPQGNLFVVGDDDQVVYGWRGARVEHLLDFEAQHPGARTLILATNYRSAQEVVRLSQNLICRNRRRVPKEIRPAPGAACGRVDLLAGATLSEQARQAAAWITARRREQGGGWDRFAVLARYHAYHYPLALVLDAGGIPHTPVPGAALAAQPPARVLLAYLTVLLRPEQASPEHWRWVARVPERYLPHRLVDGLTDQASLRSLSHHADLGPWHRAQVGELMQQLDALRQRARSWEQRPAEAVAAVVEALGVRAHYRQHCRRGRPLDEAREDIALDVLVALAQEAGSCQDLLQRLAAPPSEPGLPAPRTEGSVLLSTIHATKGEGFANVVLYNLRNEDGAEGEMDAEAERRVYYVGLTRAAEAAAITVPDDAPAPYATEMLLDPALAGCGLHRLRRRARRLQRQLSRGGQEPAGAPGRAAAEGEPAGEEGGKRVRRWPALLRAALRALRRGRGGPGPASSDAGTRLRLARLQFEIACRQTLGAARSRQTRDARRRPAP
jgi:DNA helicase-2/ATP-dependent DNA helicase PcrA